MIGQKEVNKNKGYNFMWWYTPLVTAFGYQNQEDLEEFKANLFCRADSRLTWHAQ